jgi:lipopolysaccharide export system permease protein
MVTTSQAAQTAPAPVAQSARRRSPPPRLRRLGGTLSRSVLRELAFPTLFALLGVTLLVLAADLVAYSDLVINRGFSAADVGWIALYRCVPMLGRAIPFAVLVGTLVALGRMGADREILALEASGVSARALARPVLWFAALFTALGIAIALSASPWASRGLQGALKAMGTEGSGTPLRSGAVERFGEWRLVAQEVSPRGDELRGVVLWAPPLGGTIFAEHASVSPEPGGGKRLLIEHGVVVADLSGDPTEVRFDRMQQVLESPAASNEAFGGWTASASLADLAGAVRAHGDPIRSREALQEWHQRFALPLASLAFAWLAVGLAIARRRPSRSSGAMIAIVATVAYYGLVQLGGGLGRAPGFPMVVAVWLPDGVLAAVAVLLFVVAPAWRGGRRGRVSAPSSSAAPARRPRAHRFVLDRYLLRLFLEMALMCFVALLVAYLVIDVLDNLKWFTKYRSTPDEVFRFYLARLPLLASRVVPMALLVASALTLSLLGATGELIGMRACGVATFRLVAPVLIACIVVAVAYHPLANDLVPRANAIASRIKNREIKGKTAEQFSVWSLSGDRLLQASRLDPLAGVAQDLRLYQIGPNGLPVERIDASLARHVGAGTWQLIDPERFEISSDGMRRVPADSFLKLGDEAVTEVEGEHLSIGELQHEIRTLEQRGYDATAYRVDLTLKLASPLACILLPALALLFAAGGPPFPTPVQTLVASAIAAGGWLLLSAVGASLGYGGAVPPWVAGFGPVGVLAASAVVLASRVHGFGRG